MARVAGNHFHRRAVALGAVSGEQKPNQKPNNQTDQTRNHDHTTLQKPPAATGGKHRNPSPPRATLPHPGGNERDAVTLLQIYVVGAIVFALFGTLELLTDARARRRLRFCLMAIGAACTLALIWPVVLAIRLSTAVEAARKNQTNP